MNASLHKNQKNLYPNFDMGVFLRSCEHEITSPIKGKTSGTIPVWINGHLVRNGPGSLKIGDDYFKHYFDGPALLQKFDIKNGIVSYQCRFLQSEAFKRNTKCNRIVVNEFGTKGIPDPCKTIFERIVTVFTPSEKFSDNSVISVYPLGDEIFAFGEIPVIHKIDKESLVTVGRVDIRDYVTIVHHTGHPHVTANGVYNLGFSFSLQGPCYVIVKFLATDFDKATVVAKVPVRWPLNPSYMHSFGITEHYFVIIEQPLSVTLPKVVKTLFTNDTIASCFRWFDKENTKITLVDRQNGEVVHTFFTEPFCFMHVINQYETSDSVVVDVCSYQNSAFLDQMYIQAMENMHSNKHYAAIFRSKPVRFTLPLKSDNLVIKSESLTEISCELPRINYDFFSGKPYRYFYAVNSDIDSTTPGGLIKVDTLTKTSKIWSEEDCYLSEPVFVPRPDCQFEDDGVILSVMLWGTFPNRVGLIVLDAQNFTEIGRTVFENDGPVVRCLHGWFLPSSSG